MIDEPAGGQLVYRALGVVHTAPSAGSVRTSACPGQKDALSWSWTTGEDYPMSCV